LRERLRQHTWSYSSLGTFFTCPYRFILEYIQGVAPPPCFEEEAPAGLVIGNFLHRLFAGLKDRHPAISRWPEQFEQRWESDEDLRTKLPDHAVRKAIVHSYLADIAAWEQETGRRILFSDEVTAAEHRLEAPFGDGRYRLKGRIDRLQRHEGRVLIADLKYREKFGATGRLADRVEKTDSFDDRFQLLIYAYLVARSGEASPDQLDASFIFLRPGVRGDYEGRLAGEDLADCGRIMELVGLRLDVMLEMERFAPNYRAKNCAYCPFQALCLRPDLYRTGGRPW
jgi:RecB family exonuclease